MPHRSGARLPGASFKERSGERAGDRERRAGNHAMSQHSVMRPARSANTETLPFSVQRRCACGRMASGLASQCENCQRETAHGLQTKLVVSAASDRHEQEADRVAARVLDGPAPMPERINAVSVPLISRRQVPAGARAAPAGVAAALRSPGEALPATTRADFEMRFGHDFGRVRIHRDAQAAASARAVAAHAYTVGHHLVFAQGLYAPGTGEGRRLIAHELVHVIQQGGQGGLLQRDDDEAAKKQFEAERARARARLETWAQGRNPAPSTDPEDKDYAFTAQQLAYEITHKTGDESDELLDKPADATQRKTWQTAFRDAYHLALMILESTKAEERTGRASLIAQDLATAGFVTEALDLAGKLPEDDKRNIYENVAGAAANATVAQIDEVSTYFAGDKASPGDHPFLAKLTDRSGDYARSLGKDKLLAALGPTLNKYKANADYLDDLAEILVFEPGSRVAISDWLWKADKEFLFEVLSTEYFVEPGYGGLQFADSAGNPRELTMDADMPWVYTYKQKYYTDFLVNLGKKHKVPIAAPVKLGFTQLKTWLDQETEDIGKALAAEYPDAPEKITAAYEKIADIYFHHVDRGDVTPNLAGKLGHLPASDPKLKRLAADCDVLATYAARLLKSSGFTPVGYMAIIPDADAAHAVALLKKALPGPAPAEGEAPQPGPDRYYIVNNKQVTPKDVPSKEAAIEALRDDALLVYDSEPAAYKVYYEDATPEGAMTRDLWTTQERVRRPDLGKDPPPQPAPQP
jgi:hypothetical protein